MRNDFPEVGSHLVELLPILVVARDELLIGDGNGSLLRFLLLTLLFFLLFSSFFLLLVLSLLLVVDLRIRLY